MNGLRWNSLALTMPFAVALTALSLGGCQAQPDHVDEAAAEAPPKTIQTGPSCDDLDSYCGKGRPCAAGYTCTYDSGNCGTNYFGTYPNCGATDTCYPSCQPSPSCDDFDSYCDEAHPCPSGTHCALDTSNCGSNVFGTYPDCGVTATCYPACQPD